VTDLRDLLEPLRQDVDRLPLTPGPSVRARGDRRTRRQRLAAAGGLALVLAVGVPVVGALDLGGPGALGPASPGGSAEPSSSISPPVGRTLPVGTPPKVVPGGVPARAFLTGEDWTSQLLGTVTGDDAGQPEGSIAVHSCDRDADPTGTVGVARYKAGGRFVAAEKVRRFDGVAAMDQAVVRMKQDLLDGGCAAFVADTAPNVQVSLRSLSETTSQGAGRFLVRIDSRTKDGGSELTEWVWVGWNYDTPLVWTVVLNAPLDLAAGQQEALRVAGAAAERAAGA
jgi:hypothetical protein